MLICGCHQWELKNLMNTFTTAICELKIIVSHGEFLKDEQIITLMLIHVLFSASNTWHLTHRGTVLGQILKYLSLPWRVILGTLWYILIVKVFLNDYNIFFKKKLILFNKIKLVFLLYKRMSHYILLMLMDHIWGLITNLLVWQGWQFS